MLSDSLLTEMASAGVKIIPHSQVLSAYTIMLMLSAVHNIQISEVKKDPSGSLTLSVTPTEEGGKEQTLSNVNCLLWAIGRDANVTNLGLDTAVSRGLTIIADMDNLSVHTGCEAAQFRICRG